MEFNHSNLVLAKAEAFALRMVKLYKHLRQHDKFVISKQVLRSGTSIGASITEGHYAASKADFVNKYVIAQKEDAIRYAPRSDLRCKIYTSSYTDKEAA